MGRLQCNFYRTMYVILLYWKCVQQNIDDSFYCYKGTIAISLSSTIVWAKIQSSVSYRYCYLAWAEQIKIFYSGEVTNIRVLLYTFCTGYHFKQIKC